MSWREVVFSFTKDILTLPLAVVIKMQLDSKTDYLEIEPAVLDHSPPFEKQDGSFTFKYSSFFDATANESYHFNSGFIPCPAGSGTNYLYESLW
jgi:hypothetical protein